MSEDIRQCHDMSQDAVKCQELLSGNVNICQVMNIEI